VLWFNYLDVDPTNPDWELRDRYVLSNGHCSALNYSLLARRGFFAPEELLTFRQTGSSLQGHPNKVKLKGLEASTGSLGQGLSVGHGIALGMKLHVRQGRNEYGKVRVFVNCGDGELQEGNIWEAVMSAAHYRSDNLTMMVDYNDCQIDGFVPKVKNIAPLKEKLIAFNWDVIEADGHDFPAIQTAFEQALAIRGKPTAILFKTVFMNGAGEEFENIPGYHGRPLKEDQLIRALSTLGYEFSSVEEAYESIREEVVLDA
jgi:transketolase